MLGLSVYLLSLAATAQPWFAPDATALPDRAVWRGVAWNDLDGDGDPDLAASNGDAVILYRNDGGRLTPVARIAPDGAFSGEGVALIDSDGDGAADLFVASLEGPPRHLRNLGGFRFAAVADDLAAVGVPTHAGCFADFDGDFWLDLVLVTRGDADDLLFRNDRGRFRLVAGALAGSGGDGRTCAVGDWTGDGRPEIYIGNFIDRTGPAPRRALDALFVNEGGMRFRRLAEGHVVNLPSMTYGATALDWNQDGRLDLSVSHDGRADRNVLYENRAAVAGTVDLYPRGDEMMLTTIQRGPSKGQSWGDYDNDGDLDVFYAEGTEGLTAADAPFDARDELYERVDGRFVRRTDATVDADVRLGAGAAHADLDLDGDLDLVVANWGGAEGEAMQLYRNRGGGRSISFVLRGAGPNRQAIGAQLALTIVRGTDCQVRHAFLWPQTGYGSMDEPVVHFGLAEGERVESVVVHWPGGTREAFDLRRPGNRVTLRESRD